MKRRPGAATAAAACRTAAGIAGTKIHSSPNPAPEDNNNNETYSDQTVGDCPAKESEEKLSYNDAIQNYRPGPNDSTSPDGPGLG